MSIVLAPASPLGSSASIGIGAGAAEQNAKMFPTLAALYGHIASLRGGGGGGGGHGGGGGGIQVLPRDDGGANYQVQAQAGRDQRSQDLQFEAQQAYNRQALAQQQPDLVGQHIQQRSDVENAQNQRNLTQAEAARQRAIQPFVNQAPQAPPEWDPLYDGQELATQRSIVRKASEAYNNGEGSLPEHGMLAIQGPAMAKISQLDARKRAYENYQQQQQFQAAEILQGRKDRLTLEQRKAFATNGMDGVVPSYSPDGKFMGYLQYNPKTQTMESIKGLNAGAKEKEGKPFDLVHEQKQAELETLLGGKWNSHDDAKKDPEFQRGTIESLRARKETYEQGVRMKHADPQAMQAYTTFTAPLQTQTGAIDLQRANPQQLHVLDQSLQNPKGLGMRPETAQALRRAIGQEVQRRTVPPASAPAPREHEAPFGSSNIRKTPGLSQQVIDTLDRALEKYGPATEEEKANVPIYESGFKFPWQ